MKTITFLTFAWPIFVANASNAQSISDYVQMRERQHQSANAESNCDMSVASVTQAFKRGYAYVVPDTDLTQDLYYNQDSIGSILMSRWGQCKVDLNVPYRAVRHNNCVTPRCLSSYLKLGRLQ